MEKVLSIAVPTYNMEALLPRCLDSFIVPQEEMALLEVLVVNDGSKDRSLEIAYQYAERYPDTIKVIDKPNGNYGSCINAALKVATGKYFRICDADDNYENKNLKEYIIFLSKNDTDIVFSPYKTCKFNQEIVSEVRSIENLCDKDLNIDDINWNDQHLANFRAMHCMATKRDLLIKNSYYQTEGISYTDTQFVFYSMLYANTCRFFKDCIYIYYLGRDGQTMSQAAMKKSYMHFYINADKMLADYIKNEKPISKNKRYILEKYISDCLFLFATIVLTYYPKDIKILNSILQKIDNSPYKDSIDKLVNRGRIYPLWRKNHLPVCFISLLFKLKFLLQKH